MHLDGAGQGPVAARLRRRFPSLSPQLRLAARYALDAPDDVALSSLRDVAGRAGIHPSTMVRLAKQLGYDGYASFRECFRVQLRERPANLTARAHKLQARRSASTGEALLRELLEAGVANLRSTFADLSAAELEAVADLLIAARRLYVVGMRKCFPVAYALHYACRTFRADTVLVTGLAATVADEMRDIGDADALIVVSYDPYTRETVAAAELAAERGALLVAITDSAVSPIAAPARHVFITANAGPAFFRSLTAAMALAEALVALALARSGEADLELLGRTEAQLQRFQAYWPGSRPRRSRP